MLYVCFKDPGYVNQGLYFSNPIGLVVSADQISNYPLYTIRISKTEGMCLTATKFEECYMLFSEYRELTNLERSLIIIRGSIH